MHAVCKITVHLPAIPVMTQPTPSVILKMCVMLSGSSSLSCIGRKCNKGSFKKCTHTKFLIIDAKIQKLTGTFFCVMTTAESLPRTPMEVIPPWLMALNAYSGGEKKKKKKKKKNSLLVTMTP